MIKALLVTTQPMQPADVSQHSLQPQAVGATLLGQKRPCKVSRKCHQHLAEWVLLTEGAGLQHPASNAAHLKRSLLAGGKQTQTRRSSGYPSKEGNTTACGVNEKEPVSHRLVSVFCIQREAGRSCRESRGDVWLCSQSPRGRTDEDCSIRNIINLRSPTPNTDFFLQGWKDQEKSKPKSKLPSKVLFSCQYTIIYAISHLSSEALNFHYYFFLKM